MKSCLFLTITIGQLVDADWSPTYSMKIGGISYGSPSYIPAFLDKKTSKVVSSFNNITSTLSNSNPPNPPLPCKRHKQAIWVLATHNLQLLLLVSINIFLCLLLPPFLNPLTMQWMLP